LRVEIRPVHGGAAADGATDCRGPGNGAVDADDVDRVPTGVLETIDEEQVDLISRRRKREELAEIAARRIVVRVQRTAEFRPCPRGNVVDGYLPEAQSRSRVELREGVQHPGEALVRDDAGRIRRGRVSKYDIERDVDRSGRRSDARL